MMMMMNARRPCTINGESIFIKSAILSLIPTHHSLRYYTEL